MKKTLLIASMIAVCSLTGLVACSKSTETTSTTAPAPLEQAAAPGVEESKVESVRAQAVEKVEAVKEQAVEKITEFKEQAAEKIETAEESTIESIKE